MARVNRAVELLAQDQPIYYQHLDGLGSGGEEAGRSLAGTWADYLAYDAEHAPFDAGELRAFVSGLVKGDPTRSGHRTPAVIVSLPVAGSSEAAVRANAWMVQQALATGVHGILLCNAESPEAARLMIEASRYPFAPRVDGLAQGRQHLSDDRLPLLQHVAEILAVGIGDLHPKIGQIAIQHRAQGLALLVVQVELDHAISFLWPPGCGIDRKLSFGLRDGRIRGHPHRISIASPYE